MVQGNVLCEGQPGFSLAVTSKGTSEISFQNGSLGCSGAEHIIREEVAATT